jgi:hypothetical protein
LDGFIKRSPAALRSILHRRGIRIGKPPPEESARLASDAFSPGAFKALTWRSIARQRGFDPTDI